MVNHFYRVARVPRSVLEKYREGLLVGSGCADGEVFTAMMQKGYETAKAKAKNYDYLEIQPKALYAPLWSANSSRMKKSLKTSSKIW